MTPNVLI